MSECVQTTIAKAPGLNPHLINTMNLLSIIAAVPLVGLVLAQNSAENNSYLSSTRFQRHVVNATQAGAIIQAAALESANISLPVNIAVTDPAGLVVS